MGIVIIGLLRRMKRRLGTVILDFDTQSRHLSVDKFWIPEDDLWTQ